MFCRNCGTSLKDDIKFCPNCGYATEWTENEQRIMGMRKHIAEQMAVRYMISGIIQCVFVFLNFCGAILSCIVVINEPGVRVSNYKVAIIAYLFLAILMLVWAITRFVGSIKIKRNGYYSAYNVVTASICLCVILLLRVVFKLNFRYLLSALLMLAAMAIIVYEIAGIIVFVQKNKNIFPIKPPEKNLEK